MGPLWTPQGPSGMGGGPQPLSQAQGCHLRSQQQQQRLQQQQCWQQRGLCWLCKKYGVGRGKAAAQPTLLQPAKSSLLPLLLPTLLLLKPLLPLLPTSQMATFLGP